MLLTICALFVAYVPFANYPSISILFEAPSILMTAYGQTSGPGDPGNTVGPGNSSDTGNTGSSSPGNLGGSSGPDPSVGDNSTNPSNPGDVSPVIGNNTNILTQNDTASGPDSAITVPSNLGNSTAIQTVPEFPVTMIVMMVAIASVIVFYRIRFI